MTTPFSDYRLRSGKEAELADALLEYLAEHLRASDTLDGIAKWWLGRQEGFVDQATLSNVLLDLTRRGLLEEIWSPTGARYRLKRKP